MNAVVPTEEAPRRRDAIEVIDPIPVLDTSRFEHMQRVATVMARSSLIPDALCTFGPKDNKENLPYEQVLSNCFLVVNQAVRWGLDPFAVAQCVSVVHGKLCYEGKLVSAVLDAKIGLRLHHHFVGEGEAMRVHLSDREFDAETIAELRPGFRKPGWRLFDGSVAEWKTAGNNTPWTPKNYPRMLIYRGTRDWTRIYESAIMLGVYTPDEMLDLAENARANRAREAPSVMTRLRDARSATQEPASPQEGFSRSHVAAETAALSGETGSSQDTEHETPADAPAPPATGSGEDPAPLDPPAADLSGDEPEKPGAGGIEAADGQSAPPVPADERAWLISAAKQIWAATGKGEQVLVTAISADLKKNVPASIGKPTRDKFQSIVTNAKKVCFDELDAGDALNLIAGIAGVEPKEIVTP